MLLLALLACSTPQTPATPAPEAPPKVEVVAPPATPEAAPAWMVIVAGSKNKAEAEAMLASYRTDGLPAVGDHPRLLDSGTVEGLNPGFWIVVGATVADEATAKQMSKAYQGRREGTYVREVAVTGAEEVTCPDDPRCGPAGWRAIIVFDVTDGMESEDWGFFTDDVQNRAKKAGIYASWGPDGDTWVAKVRGREGEVVGEVDMQPFIGELFGYVFAMEGKEPQYHAHDLPDSVLGSASAYFGTEI